MRQRASSHRGGPVGGPYRALFASAVGLALSNATFALIAFGVFVAPLEQAFGWGRGDLSIAITLFSWVTAALSPFYGALLDRFGVRPVLLPSILAFGIAFGSLAFVPHSLFVYYALYLVAAVVGVPMSPLSYARTVVLWFDRKRGLALGVALAGTGVGTALVPAFLQFWVTHYGWRAGFLSAGALILFVCLPIVWLFLREPVVAIVDAKDEAQPGPLPGQSLTAAVRTRPFWQMLIGFLVLGVVTGALLAHLVPVLQSRGLSAGRATSLLAVLGIAIMLGRPLVGHLLDRFFAPPIVGVCLSGLVVGLLILWSGPSGPLIIAAVLLIGLAVGAEFDFMAYLISRYHGMRAYAKISGLLYAVFVLGSGSGPVLMGYVYQYTQSYDGALVVLTLLASIALPLFLALGRYPDFASSVMPPEPRQESGRAA